MYTAWVIHLSPKLLVLSLLSILSLLSVLSLNLANAQVPNHQSCKSCHIQQWQAWETSAHKTALKSLAYGDQRNLKCQGCHNEVGLRSLLQSQYRLKSEKRPKQKSTASNIDCLSCHGMTQFLIQEQRHQWSDQAKYRLRAQDSCSACHILPPLDSQKTFKRFDAHSLKPKTNVIKTKGKD